MSAEALAIALHHSKAKGTAKLVLLGIANHDGDGGSWPSVATLAKYANVDARSVQRAIETLVSLREIRRLYNAGGSAKTPEHLRPNLYEILLGCPSHCDGTKAHRDRRDLLQTTLKPPPADPVTPVSPPDASVTRTSP